MFLDAQMSSWVGLFHLAHSLDHAIPWEFSIDSSKLTPSFRGKVFFIIIIIYK